MRIASIIPSFLLILILVQAPAFASTVNCNGKAREQIDKTGMVINYKGRQFYFSIGNNFKLFLGETALQTMDKVTQDVNMQMVFLADLYNACKIDEKKFEEISDTFFGYADRLRALDRISEEIKNSKNGITEEQKKQARKLEDRMVAFIKSAREKYASEVKAQATVLENAKGEISDLDRRIKEEAERSDEFQKKQEKDLRDFTAHFNSELDTLRAVLSDHETRLMIIESFLKGKLKSTQRVYSLGVTAPYVDNTFKDRLGVQFSMDLLYSNESNSFYNLIPFFEGGYVSWKETISYPTLPGNPDGQFIEDNSYYFLGAGLKKYFEVIEGIHAYLGAEVGYTFETEKNGVSRGFYNYVGGISLYPYDIKTSVEIRYGRYSFNEERRQFNLFGSALTSEEEVYRRFPSLVFTISW
jgi:hypothetical protein